MKRRGAVLLAVAATLQAALAAAQDRPPDRPLDRPAGRPPAAEAGPQGRPPADPRPAAGPQPEAPVEAALAFGPPAPPRWFTLRETDRDYAACRLALSLLGTVYAEQPPVTDPEDPDCGIARPIRVDRILPDLTVEGGAVMRCDTARALGFWARDFLRPAGAVLSDAPRITGLQLGSTYDCRPRVGTGADRPKLSEHALGTAVDIAAFVFDGGNSLAVQPRQDSGDLAEAFQRTARAAGCLYFTTVLGPGSNEAHADHLHLDLAERRGGWRLCQ